MKKFLFVLMGVFAVAGAFAAGENVPTSKSYVDAAVAQKQDKISASIIVPAGYTQLEYIESTGTQYIDTGIIPTNYDWYADFTMSTSAFGKYFFGAGGSVSWWCDAPGYYFGIANSAGSSQWGQGCADSVASNNLGVLPNIFYNYKISKYGIYVNGLLKSEMRNSINLSGTSSLYIARTNSSSVSQYNNSLSKWRTVKIYNDIDHIVFHGIPARRNSDGEIGMYDTVTNTFFTNAGTGEFIAGPVIIPDIQVLSNTGTVGKIGAKGIYDANGAYATQTQNLVDAATMNAGVQNAIDSEFQCIEWLDPNDHSSDCLLLQLGGITQVPAGYTQLEYLESTGTQYIDTGIWIQKDTTAKLDMSAELLPTGWFGSNAFLQLYITPSFYALLSNSNPSVKIIPGNRDTIILDYDSNKVLNLYINGNFIQKTPWNTLTETQSKFYVFALGNFNGNVFTAMSRPIKGKVYSIKLSVNNTLVRNFIPARRDSDGKIGMYDTVSNTFFTNSGTGEFIPGPVVNLYLPEGN